MVYENNGIACVEPVENGEPRPISVEQPALSGQKGVVVLA
jgi:hypothetical protein